jgi:hypothetical protein
MYLLSTKILMRISLVLLLTLLILPPGVSAGGARIEKIATEKVLGAIWVSFELTNGFNRAIQRDIQDGIEKDFYYYIVLNQKHQNWFYEEVAEKTLRYRVKYDTLTKVYTVRRFEEDFFEEHVFDSLSAMRDFVSRGEKIRLAGVSLKQNHRYHVWVKAQMKASRVPLHLDRFLFFIPFLELDTPWKKSAAIYAP